MIWHSTNAGDVLKELGVDDKKGLANSEAEMRLENYGGNIITKIEKPSYFKRFLSQLNNKIVIILIVVALISFAVSLMYKEVNSFSPLLIIGIVFINAAVSAYHIYSCDNAIENMKNATNPSVTVLRDGVLRNINSAALVPGDIIMLEQGDYISADARILESNELRCNEAQITGDEIPVEKNSNAVTEDIAAIEERSNMVFSGSSVAHGSAKAVVVATGLNTELGRTEAIMQQTGEEALPFENELDIVGKFVNAVILAVCFIVFIIGMIQNFSDGNFASTTLKVLVNSIALAVAAIPEGLPAIATIVIATGIQRIIADNIKIKDSKALEFIGKTDIICSDKTGILTRNKMVLSKIYDGDKLTDAESEALEEKTVAVLKLASACSTLANDSTEAAIKNACLAYGSMSEKDIDAIFPKLTIIPFDSERKTMTVITMINEKPFAIVKGAAEIVLPKCVGCNTEEILKLNNELADEALRIVCIAMRQLETIPANPNPAEIETGLTFVGLLGLKDPPRDTIISDIEILNEAGVRTVMITGDNLITAKAVARRIGILKDGTTAVTGEELALMDDDTLKANISKYSVFARVSPSDKLRIVKAWQSNKKTVTVTGDSIQDADALAAADVGCAMGKFGADVAKGSADIVISNSRFESIVCAVRESRGLFDNIKKSLYYLLSCNFAEIITVLFGMIIFSGTPIAAVQFLWINLLTDCAPAISLSMEKAEPSVMKRKAGDSTRRLFDGSVLISIALQSIFIAAMTLIAFAVGRQSGTAVGMTMAFAVLGITQIFHCYNNKFSGTVFNKKILSNRFMNLSAIITLFIIVFLLFTPAGYVFGLEILTLKQFAVCLLLSLLILPFSELTKLLKSKINF